MKKGIFVLGAHRSGTSVLTSILQELGINLGSSLLSPTDENPDGFFENIAAYQLNKRILLDSKSNWDDCTFRLDTIKPESYEKYVVYAKNILLAEFKYSDVFALKDPRLCLLFPVWKQACEELNIDAHAILVIRNPLEISYSLRKRNAFTIEKGLLIWFQHFIYSEYYSRNNKREFTYFNEMIENFEGFIRRLTDFLGVNLDEKITANTQKRVKKDLKHHTLSIDSLSSNLPSFIKKLLEVLKSKDFSNTKKLDEIRTDFEYTIDILMSSRFESLINDNASYRVKDEQNQAKISEITLRLEQGQEELNATKIKSQGRLDQLHHLQKDLSKKETLLEDEKAKTDFLKDKIQEAKANQNKKEQEYESIKDQLMLEKINRLSLEKELQSLTRVLKENQQKELQLEALYQKSLTNLTLFEKQNKTLTKQNKDQKKLLQKTHNKAKRHKKNALTFKKENIASISELKKVLEKLEKQKQKALSHHQKYLESQKTIEKHLVELNKVQVQNKKLRETQKAQELKSMLNKDEVEKLNIKIKEQARILAQMTKTVEGLKTEAAIVALERMGNKYKIEKYD